jgi:hypothetical protein
VSQPRYRLLEMLSRGGMGVLYRGWDTKLERPVAIKILANPADLDAQQRALLEAKAATRIRSDHVVQIYDTGTTSELGRPYLVMELLQGEDLESVIRRGPVAPMLAVDWILQACEALAHLGRHGLVHRDVKPANLFLEIRVDGSRRLKLLDFGVAKDVRRLPAQGASLTNDGALIGSIPYVSPEQVLDSRDVDVRADLWGLGSVLYELLAGSPAFEAKHRIDVVNQITRQRHMPLSERRPELPRGLSQVVDRCLEKKREKRWPGIAELSRALGPFASREGSALVPKICAICEGELVGSLTSSRDWEPASAPLAIAEAGLRLADPDIGVRWGHREGPDAEFVASGPAATTLDHRARHTTQVGPRGIAGRWSSWVRHPVLHDASVLGPFALALTLGAFLLGSRGLPMLQTRIARSHPAAADCAPPEARYEALDMDHDAGTGTSRGADWVIYTNGSAFREHVFAPGRTELSVTAGGDLAGDALPHLIVSVDGEPIGEADILSKHFATYSFQFEARGGRQTVALTFSNDYLSDGEDRNLVLRELAISRCAQFSADLVQTPAPPE